MRRAVCIGAVNVVHLLREIVRRQSAFFSNLQPCFIAVLLIARADKRPYRFFLSDWKAIGAALTAGLSGAT